MFYCDALKSESSVAGSPVPEDPIHRVGGVTPHCRQEVTVQVHRYPEAGMAQQIGDHLRRHALSEQQGCRAVPQVVKPQAAWKNQESN